MTDEIGDYKGKLANLSHRVQIMERLLTELLKLPAVDELPPESPLVAKPDRDFPSTWIV